MPEYKSYRWQNWHVRFGWEPFLAGEVYRVSPKRALSRIDNYVIPDEIDRVNERLKLGKRGGASIRFGSKKTGHGIHGERGDFCLVGGVIAPPTFTAFYRSVDLIGGFLYDLCIFDYVFDKLSLSHKIKHVEIFACSAHVLGLRGNSNEGLYRKMRPVVMGHADA